MLSLRFEDHTTYRSPTSEIDVVAMARRARPAWHGDALCKEYPELSWFPERGDDTRAQKAICARCLVREECEQAGYAANESEVCQGIWGATTGLDRRNGKRPTAADLARYEQKWAKAAPRIEARRVRAETLTAFDASDISDWVYRYVDSNLLNHDYGVPIDVVRGVLATCITQPDLCSESRVRCIRGTSFQIGRNRLDSILVTASLGRRRDRRRVAALATAWSTAVPHTSTPRSTLPDFLELALTRPELV